MATTPVSVPCATFLILDYVWSVLLEWDGEKYMKMYVDADDATTEEEAIAWAQDRLANLNKIEGLA